MSANGYQQAIENFVFEVDRIAEELDNMPGSLSAKTLSLLARDSLFSHFEAEFRQLDRIISVIANTYHRDESQVEEDINKFMKEKVKNAFEEVLKK